MPGALHDVRVLDFTHALNGPFCTMLLGHLGAEIIKIESPNGDNFRHIWMPPGSKIDGYEFLWINVNKKSVVLNLKSKTGIDLARRLIVHADVLVENYQKGTMERFGLDYQSIKAINPRLIYACSRGYGEWGPYAEYGNTAATNNSIAGWTYTAWQESGVEGKRALGIGDEAAGISMALGILAALHARQSTGEGQKIEVSMQEAVLGFMIFTARVFYRQQGRRPADPGGRRLFYLAHAGNQRCRMAATGAGNREGRSRRGRAFCHGAGAQKAPQRTRGIGDGLGAAENTRGSMGGAPRSGLLRRAGFVHWRGA